MELWNDIEIKYTSPAAAALQRPITQWNETK